MVDDTGNSNDAGNAGSTNEDGNDGAGQNDGQNAGSNEEKVLTQAEADKAIQTRLAREKAKHDQEIADLNKKIQDMQTEKDLATLSEKDREQKRKDIELETLRAENEKYKRNQAVSETERELLKRGFIPPKDNPDALKFIASSFTGASIDETLKNLDAFEAIYKLGLETGINERLKGKTLETGTRTADLSSNPYSDMGWNETAQGVIERNDPDKAKALKSQVLADPKNTMFKRYNK